MAEWMRLRNLQVQGGRQGPDLWAPTRLSDDLPMGLWQAVRDRQVRGLLPTQEARPPARQVALLASQAPTEVEGVTVIGRKPPAPAPRPQPAKGPLRGRPGIAAIVAEGLNTIASGPNTSAPIREPDENPRVSGTVTRGAGRDVQASGTVRIPKLPGALGRLTVGAEGVLDPPTGRAEISASRVKGDGIGLPSRVRVYTTPSGELDVHLPGPIKVGGIPVVPAGTYVIGTPDPPKPKR